MKIKNQITKEQQKYEMRLQAELDGEVREGLMDK